MFDLGNHDILRTTIYSPLGGTHKFNYGSSLKKHILFANAVQTSVPYTLT